MKALRQFSTIATLSLAAASSNPPLEIPNPAVDISSCQALPCSPPNGSICSPEAQLPDFKAGVGIAADVVNTSSASLSLTLIDGLDEPGFTGMSIEEYEHSDQQLFVGIDPHTSSQAFPAGCALMMQYNGQTFPKETYPNVADARETKFRNTTSCDGVIDVFCQSAITRMIRGFNESSEGEGDKCQRLTQHLWVQLQSQPHACGHEGTWIASAINITGGSLPAPNDPPTNHPELVGGNGQCPPVLPANYDLYQVAVMREFYFSDPPRAGSDHYGRVFGGRSGFTPVITVVDDGKNKSANPDVQFSCMKTYQPDGEPIPDAYGGSARARPTMALTLVTLLSLIFVV